MVSTFGKGIELLRTNPRLFLSRAKQKARDSVPSRQRSVSAPETVSRSVDDVVQGVIERNARTVLVVGDSDFWLAVTARLPSANLSWASHLSEDVARGAISLLSASFQVDCIAVGGSEVGIAYAAVLRALRADASIPPLLWAGNGWEFCGSQLPVPADADDVDVFLYNHFENFFLVKDPLAVRITARHATFERECWRILEPGQTLLFRMAELLPDRVGPALIDIMAEHPTLTKHRHQRWRVCADVHWKGSLTTLHGGHDYGPPREVQSRRPLSDVIRGRVSVVIPTDRPAPHGESITVMVGEQRSRRVGCRATPVDELNFEPVASNAKNSFYGYEYEGVGTPFWYAYSAKETTGRPVISSNHEISLTLDDDLAWISSQGRRRAEDLEDQGLHVHAHALPLDKSGTLEFGLDFSASNPPIRRFSGFLFDTGGGLMQSVAFDQSSAGPLYCSQLLDRFETSDDPKLLVFWPDWRSINTDPVAMNVVGDFA